MTAGLKPKKESAIRYRSLTYLCFFVLLNLALTVQMALAAVYAADNGAYLLTGSMAALGGRSTDQQAIIVGSSQGSPQQTSTDGSWTLSGGFVALAFGRGSFLPISHAEPPVDTMTVHGRTIALHLEGDTAQSHGRLYYRRGGDTSFAELPMTSTAGGDSLLGEIPSSLFSLRGVEYYVDVERSSLHAAIGTRSSPRRLVTRVTNEQGQRSSQPPDQKYRIISVPVNIEGDSSIEAVFEDDYGSYDRSFWRLSRYNAMTGSYTEFPNVTAVSPGRGYWLITRDLNRSYGSAGLSVQPNRTIDGEQYYELPLDSGWNQLGNPFAFDIDWRDILFSTGGQIIGHNSPAVEDSIYWYDGNKYRTIITVPAWDGFFLNVRRDQVTALFPYRESKAANAVLSPLPEVEPDSEEWTLRLSLVSGNLTDGANFVGLRRGASDDIDRFDYAEPPGAPGAPMLALAGPTQRVSNAIKGQCPCPPLRCDYRSSRLPGHSWKLLMSPGTDRVLSFEGTDELPSGLRLSLAFDGIGIIQLTTDTSLSVPDNVTEAWLLAGDAAHVPSDEPPLPRQFALYQNYPNPFNPSSAISFALPEPRHVTLEIINVLGQRVSQLIDARLGAGKHSVIWDGRNSVGRAVASGVYFYRIKAGDFVDTKKLVLLR